jgi:predicted transposase YbfD/YdcC
LPVAGDEETKQTNEIGMFIPLVDQIDITGKTVTTDALLTQRHLAHYLVAERKAHYLFTVKGNQPTLLDDIRLIFEGRGQPDFHVPPTLAHGRIESRKIWTSTALNDYLDFPLVGQVFVIERHTLEKKTGKGSTETAYGLTSHSPDTANARRVLAFNRGHWTIENGCHYLLDWNLRRGSLHHPHRPWSRQHHPPPSLRDRPPEVQSPRQRRGRDPQVTAQRAPGLRLPADDRKFPTAQSRPVR